MEKEQPAGKLPIPRLTTTAYTAKQPKKRKTTEEKLEARRLWDQRRAQSRVNLGYAFTRWRALRSRLGLHLDQELAEFLIDSYKKLTEALAAENPEPATSSPLLEPQQKHFKKLTEESSVEKPEPATSSPRLEPLQTQDKPLLLSPSAPSEPLLTKCPSCGFALNNSCLQNGNVPSNEYQPESIEITLEVEERDDPVSGAEEADGESDVSEEESEGLGVNEGEISDEDWTLDREVTPALTRTRLTDEESDGSEEEESKGSGVNERENSDEDWTPDLEDIPGLTRTRLIELAAVEEDEEQESRETAPRPEKRKLCPECGVFFQMKHHVCEHKSKPFVCIVCGRRFVSETALKIHSGIHSESYEHACKYCYASFKTKVDKLAHELVHQEQKDPFKCSYCAMTFTTFRKRGAHLKQHRNENPLKCAICGLEFQMKLHFVRHAAVHTGEKQFKCSVCQRSFKQASHLSSHMRLHTGERPYGCKHCDRSFNHNVSLKSHVQRYHPEQEDISVEAEDEKERNEENKEAAAKSKGSWVPTGRPKGRPKRKAAVKRKYSRVTDESDDES